MVNEGKATKNYNKKHNEKTKISLTLAAEDEIPPFHRFTHLSPLRF